MMYHSRIMPWYYVKVMRTIDNRRLLRKSRVLSLLCSSIIIVFHSYALGGISFPIEISLRNRGILENVLLKP